MSTRTEDVKERVKDTCIAFGDGLCKFHTRDITHLHNQLEIEEAQNDMLINELEDLKSQIVVSEHKVKELTEAVEWALNNCKPERDELHSDFFNILTNALNVPE
jgi:hypothetical protein